MLSFSEMNLDDEGDVEFMFEARSHPQIVMLLFGLPPKDMESHRAWLKKNVPEFRHIFLLRDNGTRVGYAHVYDFIGKDTVEMGIVVHPLHQGKGYGKHMVKETVRWLRENMPGKKIVLYVKKTNDRAMALYAKSGFVMKERNSLEAVFEME